MLRAPKCDGYIQIFKYLNTLVRNIYSDIHSYQFFFDEYIRKFVYVKFVCTNIFRHSFVSLKTRQIFEYIWIFIQFSIQIFIQTFVCVKKIIQIYSDIHLCNFLIQIYSDIYSCQNFHECHTLEDTLGKVKRPEQESYLSEIVSTSRFGICKNLNILYRFNWKNDPFVYFWPYCSVS